MKKLKSISPTIRFFRLLAAIAALFAISFAIEWLFVPAQVILALTLAFGVADYILLVTQPMRIPVVRTGPRILSLGNVQTFNLSILNGTNLSFKAEVIDELPYQLQKRDLSFEAILPAGKKIQLSYQIRAVKRGLYNFGKVNLILRTSIGLMQIHIQRSHEESVSVYPSILDMKELEMSAFNTLVSSGGIRKIRRIGHSYAFEQIKEYVTGDEFRSINWKATGRRGKLMVNQYEDERSQQIICVLDQSRAMQLPFKGLSLLDYSVNASLAISNIALRKHDKAGLINFSSKYVSFISPERSRTQMKKLLENLYTLKESELEPNFELLYSRIRSGLNQRSLLFLFTNFESMYALERAIPLLRRINKSHLLVITFFENEEIANLAEESAKSLEGIYVQTIARKSISGKLQMLQTLRQHGIQSIYTRPEDLSVQVTNKYLELKSRGLI